MKKNQTLRIAKAFYDGTLTEADRAKMGTGMRVLIELAESRDQRASTAKLAALRDLAELAQIAGERRDVERDLRNARALYLLSRTHTSMLITKRKIAEYEATQMRRLVVQLRRELYARINENPTLHPAEQKLPPEEERLRNKF